MRHFTHTVRIGDLQIGGGHAVAVQSMTDTDTADVAASTAQVLALAQAGSEMVRLTINNEAAARAVVEIHARLQDSPYPVPLIGDFHYNGHSLLQSVPRCGKVLAKYRINPGNVGRGANKDAHFAAIIRCAMDHDKPVRIGVNWGSLDPQLLQTMMDENARQPQPLHAHELMCRAMIRSALESAAAAEALGLPADHIVLSVKTSRVPDLIASYRALAAQSSYALHVGLTEAGMGMKGMVSSSAALAVLLHEGIGDTIRVSLTPEPNSPRTQEVRLAEALLQALELRHFAPSVTSCPGCGRTSGDYFRHLAQDVQEYIDENMPLWRSQYPGVERLKVAVMGCVVNGPGESKAADIGISLPGSGESPSAPVYIDGEKYTTLKGENISSEFKQLLNHYIKKRYSGLKQEVEPLCSTLSDNHE